MKCVCGYEYEKGVDMVIVGDDPFTRMVVHGEMKHSHDLGYDTDEIADRSLYICPKCGTVRFEKYL